MGERSGSSEAGAFAVTGRRGTLGENRKAAGRLRAGAWLGLGAAILAIVTPSVAILLSAIDVAGTKGVGTALLEVSGAVVLAGAILYIVSLFLYRRAFAVLRR